MPKIKWGAGEGGEVLTARDIDEAEDRGFAPYAGEVPPAGLYRFRIAKITYETFKTGSQGFSALLVLDGSWKAEHAQFDGCPLWDRLVMLKSTAGFAKAYAHALGVSSRDIISNVVVDDDKNVVTIGKATPKGMLIGINATRTRQNQDSPWRLEVNGSGYLPAPEGSEAPPAEKAAANGAGGKPKKDKKSKGGKKAAADDEAAPF